MLFLCDLVNKKVYYLPIQDFFIKNETKYETLYEKNDIDIGRKEMEDNVIYIDLDDAEGFDPSKYSNEPSSFFKEVPEVAEPLLKGANKTFDNIKKIIYRTPAVLDSLKTAIPEMTFQAVFTDEQKIKIAEGTLKLMTKKDGKLLATLIDHNTKKIVATVPLKSIKKVPELSKALDKYSTQMQMAQIAEQIQLIQSAIDDVRLGQENDRLATAYSCQQKLIQAREIKNPALKMSALLQIALSSEDSRNRLMLSQKESIKYLQEQPEAFWAKLLGGDKASNIEARLKELREGLKAINMVSLSETMAYFEMGEHEAAKVCLKYYGDYIKETYLSLPGLVERLDLMDPSPENYWSKTLPKIKKNIGLLPHNEEIELIGE